MKRWPILLASTLGVLAGAEQAPAGAWVLTDRRNEAHLTLLRQDTRERYFLDGRRIPYFFEGRNQTTGVFLDYRRALNSRLEGGAQLSFFSLRFDDLADRRRSNGIGDLRLGLRYNLLGKPFVGTVGAAVKLPTGSFVNDAEVVPVGEGQYDVEATAEIGRSLWPRPAYVTGLFGYRARTENAEAGIDPGDELFWSFEAGYTVLKRVTVKAVVRGLHGGDATRFGLAVRTRRREAVYVQPALVLGLGAAGDLELAVPFTVKGRNYPAGAVFGIGFHRRF